MRDLDAGAWDAEHRARAGLDLAVLDQARVEVAEVVASERSVVMLVGS